MEQLAETTAGEPSAGNTKPARLVFTTHAVQRLRERFPRTSVAGARSQILAAIRARRFSQERPVAYVWRHHPPEEPGVRFVWDRAETRCYVLTPTGPENRRVWLVKTVLAPVFPCEAAA